MVFLPTFLIGKYWWIKRTYGPSWKKQYYISVIASTVSDPLSLERILWDFSSLGFWFCWPWELRMISQIAWLLYKAIIMIMFEETKNDFIFILFFFGILGTLISLLPFLFNLIEQTTKINNSLLFCIFFFHIFSSCSSSIRSDNVKFGGAPRAGQIAQFEQHWSL